MTVHFVAITSPMDFWSPLLYTLCGLVMITGVVLVATPRLLYPSSSTEIHSPPLIIARQAGLGMGLSGAAGSVTVALGTGNPLVAAAGGTLVILILARLSSPLLRLLRRREKSQT